MKKHLIMILAVVLLMTLGTVGTAFAVEGDNAGDSDAYKYRVTIYSGAQGIFAKGKVVTADFEAGKGVAISCEQTASGVVVKLNGEDLGFKLKDKKYYARGLRVTGHDNDETGGYQTINITNIDTDVAYEIAYGIKGAMVAYTVNYQDANGRELRASDTYYGMPGDRPVVAYRYIDGYTPNAYNLKKELTSNEADNVFTFTYTRGETPVTVVRRADGTPVAANGARAPGTAGNPAGTAAAAAPGANAGAGDGGTTIGDNGTPLADGPQQFTDLDDNDTPQAEGLFGQNKIPFLIGSAVLLAIIIALILFYLKRRRAEEAGGGE